uniref:Uncharacterized protein n=1 Tax=Anopheles atroparvus TaxID=41427 RepID=A0AAG5D5L0_ANOAO
MERGVFYLALLQHTLVLCVGAGEGIEKVSYLLQYGPGVHTVFEQQNPPVNETISNVNDRVATSSIAPGVTINQTSTIAVETFPESTTVERSNVSSSTLAVTERVSEKEGISEGTVGPPIVGETTAPSTTMVEEDVSVKNITKGEASSLVQGPANETMAVSVLPSISSSTVDLLKADSFSTTTTTTAKSVPPTPPPSMSKDTSGTIDTGSTIASGCRAPISVLRKPQPLPLPPALPTFGSTLRTDVMVNLKPKELRTLMSTYIGLIEAYKSFNQQQRKNIAQLEEELARHELVSSRAERLSNTKLQIIKK